MADKVMCIYEREKEDNIHRGFLEKQFGKRPFGRQERNVSISLKLILVSYILRMGGIFKCSS
jgi:hypothetical protein